MPRVEFSEPTRLDILNFQKSMDISDRELGLMLVGPIADPAGKVRGWKAGKEPTFANLLAFHYLRALVSIANLNPTYGEDIYGIAHSALPSVLQ